MRKATVLPFAVLATLFLSSSISRAEARAEGRGPAGNLTVAPGTTGNPTLLESHDVTPVEFEAIRAAIDGESWEEALDLIAEKLSEIKNQSGPDSLAFLASAKCTNEENYLMQKFARAVIGTNNIDHCARL